MSLRPAVFLDEFDGKWDGHEREIHGLVENEGKHYKVEVLRRTREKYLVSVFEGGAVQFSDLTSNPVAILRDFWSSSEP